MDFKVTESNSYAYGDIYIALDFEVNVLAFSVYTKEIAGDTFKLFNTEGQNTSFVLMSTFYQKEIVLTNVREKNLILLYENNN